MSTRGILSIRFQGLDYTTYNHSDSYPKGLGLRVILFAMEYLHSLESIQAFGLKIARMEWTCRGRGSGAHNPQGADLLFAIATGKADRVAMDNGLFQTGLDCEFAYILDLDQGVLGFWHLPERVESFRLDTISQCAVDVMDCGRRR